MPTQTSSKIGYGQDFDGNDDYITLPSGCHTPLSGTVEMWEIDDKPGDGWWSARFYDRNQGVGYLVLVIQDDGDYSFYNWNNWWIQPNTNDAYGRNYYNYLTFGWEDGAQNLRINDTTTGADSYSAPPDYAYDNIWIGITHTLAHDLDGRLDELRISDIKRSDEWLNTSYYSMNSPSSFMIIGEEQLRVLVDDDYNETTRGWQITHFDKIQDGVDAVLENGPVYVFNGTYYENVEITKDGIQLIGEDKNNTIIDCGGSVDGVLIENQNYVTMSGFTVRNASFGIFIRVLTSGTANHNSISDCIICDNSKGGIYFDIIDIGQHADYNIISNCEIYNNGWSGILIVADQDGGGWSYAKYNQILNCKIYNNGFSGISSPDADGIAITPEGGVDNTLISGCEFYGNLGYGVFIEARGGSADNNFIYHNNFLDETDNAYDECTNFWYNETLQEGNYYDDHTGEDLLEPFGIGDTPYNISGGSNQDLYPLMYPWNGTIFRIPSWWDSDWHYRKQITIDHTMVDDNLTNFPVLISNTSIDFSEHAQSDGDDFVFTSYNGSIQYNHEIEKFDNVTGEIIAWVNITSVTTI